MSLSFQQKIFDDCLNEDNLTVIAKGLGKQTVLKNLLSYYCEPEHLVFVLGWSNDEKDSHIEEIKLSGNEFPPKCTDSENSNERTKQYEKGGVFFVKGRGFTVDLLTKKILAHLITGIIICNADWIQEFDTTWFSVNIYRRMNKTGFIKAFSENPENLVSGFASTEKIMKYLYLSKLKIWPRFHAKVISDLEAKSPTVFEVSTKMTENMLCIHNCIKRIMGAIIKEITRDNHIEIEDYNAELVFLKSYHLNLKQQLEPIWNSISPKTKQLLKDLNELRKMATYLIEYDCVSFNRYVEMFRSEKIGLQSVWMRLDETNTLFITSKKRVFSAKKKNEKGEDENADIEFAMVLEENPKWNSLAQILSAIEIENNNKKGKKGNVLILVKDSRTCFEIQKYLQIGGKKMLEEKWKSSVEKEQYFDRNESEPTNSTVKKYTMRKNAGTNSKPKKQNKKKKNEISAARVAAKFRNELLKNAGSQNETKDQEFFQDQNCPLFEILTPPFVVVHTFTREKGRKILEELQPEYVIVYDSNLSFVREIEIFQSERKSRKLKVYFLSYKESVEEINTKSFVTKERDSFDKLIEIKANMVVESTREGKDEEIEIEEDFEFSSRKNSKKSCKKGQIIVDSREFGSKLPAILYHKGFQITPITIEIGDYVLSPNICVERKSVPDLFSSFKDGRLFKQAENMCKNYETPILLIEFEDRHKFALQTEWEIEDNVSSHNIISKIVLLSFHFPKLKLFWSRNLETTFQFFENLKKNAEEPDIEKILSRGADVDEDDFNLSPQRILEKLPGITSENVGIILEKVANLLELSKLNKNQLIHLIGNKNGSLLHSFFNRKIDNTLNNKNNKNSK